MQLVAACQCLQVHRECQLSQREALEEGGSMFGSDFIVKLSTAMPFCWTQGEQSWFFVGTRELFESVLYVSEYFSPQFFLVFQSQVSRKNASIPPKPGNKEHWVGSFRCKRLIQLSYPRLLSPLSDLFHADIVSWIKMIQKIMFYWFLDILLDTKPSMDVILFFFFYIGYKI